MKTIGYLVYIPFSYFIIIMVDSVTQSRPDIKKILLITVLNTAILIFLFKPESIVVYLDPNQGYITLASSSLKNIGSLSMSMSGIMYFYFAIVLFRYSPKKFRKWSLLHLIGATLFGLASPILHFLDLPRMLPGIINITVSAGALFFSVAFIKEPNIAYFISFKALKLIIFNTQSGLPLFSYNWIKGQKPEGLSKLSGMLNVVGKYLNDSFETGTIKEIQMEHGVLYYRTDSELPISMILAASNSSSLLKSSLWSFSNYYFNLLHNMSIKNALEFLNTNRFEVPEKIIRMYFPMIPDSLLK